VKNLKDYLRDEWMEAADGCDLCGAVYQVRVNWVDDTGCFGDIVYRISHTDECPERWESVSEEEGEESDYAGWEFMENPFTFKGKQYYPLKSRANIGPCLECGKLIIGVPLILFIDEGKGGELDFCWSCAEKLGILKELTVKETGGGIFEAGGG